MSIKVMLVDDHRMVSEALSALLAREKDIEIVAIANNGREAVQAAKELRPDIVVMDLSMPEMNGLEASRNILSDLPNCRVIALSMHSDRKYVVEAIRSGARGYILKDSAYTSLPGAIRDVVENNGYLDPKITGLVIKDYFRYMNESYVEDDSSPLSSREREVLQLIAEGKNTKEIAFQLDITIKTVETHRRQIMQKLRLGNIAEMTRYAIKEGVTTL
jgi:DNA-binding NarL/FixJ family response regulator